MATKAVKGNRKSASSKAACVQWHLAVTRCNATVEQQVPAWHGVAAAVYGCTRRLFCSSSLESTPTKAAIVHVSICRIDSNSWH